MPWAPLAQNHMIMGKSDDTAWRGAAQRILAQDSQQPARLSSIRRLRLNRHMESDTRLIRLIALFKLLKAVLLIAVGLGALHLLHSDISSVLAHWVKMFGLNPGGRYLDKMLQQAVALTPNAIRGLGVGSFIYAGLFLTEGIGLWLLKRWAEWFTIIVTSSLVPVEVYELYRHPTAFKVLVLIINVAVVGFLLYRIRANTPT
jgi:uncharacterized membrane protein (DUF2068 family)